MQVINESVVYNNKFIIDMAGITEKGGRNINEDSILHILEKEAFMLAIADGLGAHGGGDIASGTAISVAGNMFNREKRSVAFKSVYNLYQEINQAIYAKQTDEIKMKTTFACLIAKKHRISISNLGDTRIYSFENEDISEITVDHSLSYEEVMKNGGTLDDVRNHPKRYILNAALGVSRMRRPDIYKRALKDSQAFLICSDGFWEFVYESDMTECLKTSGSSNEWLQKMIEIHHKRAYEWHDNYSAIAVKIIKLKKEDGICNTKG